MSLADEAQGRIIHVMLDIKLTPPQTETIGHTDMAVEIGRGLIREAAQLLRTAAEQEGFTVELTVSQVVY